VSSQAVYHVVATTVDQGVSPSTIILCKPSAPLVCIGYHQELDKEVDTEYCSSKNLPIVRRILGGGAVYLDSNQLFYQVIARRSEPEVPGSIEEIFRAFLEAPTKTYNDIGIRAQYRAINDIEVDGRKISGSGATEIGASAILTGNIIFDFNFDEMTKILKVPSEKFRDKVFKTLSERLTTVRKELGESPSTDSVKRLLKQNYESTLGIELVKGKLSETEANLMKSTEEKYGTRDWLHLVENQCQDLIQKRNLKISGRSYVGEASRKAPGGLVRVLVETKDDKIQDIMITGDFCFIPPDHLRSLEKDLRGKDLTKEALIDRIDRFYKEHNIESPGMAAEDVADAILAASSKSVF
jgi:lipoate-protein ligase A